VGLDQDRTGQAKHGGVIGEDPNTLIEADRYAPDRFSVLGWNDRKNDRCAPKPLGNELLALAT
jgi:hypothetical protein